jgi:uncharacterized membrane protein (DUF4010 family)
MFYLESTRQTAPQTNPEDNWLLVVFIFIVSFTIYLIIN